MSILLLTSLAFANPIVNGAIETDYPSVIALGAKFNEVTFSACTGNLITPRLVLSAAHCGGQIPKQLLIKRGLAFFGDSVDTAETSIGFDDISVHPDYIELESTPGGTLGEYDLSILTLSEDAPYPASWLRTEPMIETEIEMETVVSVGFGVDDGSAGTGGGVKRSAELTIDHLTDMHLVSNSQTNDNSANICGGDSGGPQFFIAEDGREIQWSVHSWGDSNCTYNSGSTRIDIVSEWILDHVETVHGTRDLCEANGRYGDGICDEACDVIDQDCLEDTGDGAGDAAECGCQTGVASMRLVFLYGLLAAVFRRRKVC